jgi:hypothetical protein
MRLLKILASLLAGALLVTMMLGLKAQAQSRYDADQQWVRKTIKDERRAERRERHALEIEYQDRRWRESPPRHHHYSQPQRHYYAPPPKRERYDRHDWRYQDSRRRHDHHHGTRVYGVAIRRLDATGATECYPNVEAYSVEANTEDGAWRDAQRNWENVVRAMYGERFMDIKHAKIGGERQCWLSSGNQSVAGRMMERVGSAVQGVTGNEGGLDGRKHRCRVLLSPCQAPKEINPDTKGDKR